MGTKLRPLYHCWMLLVISYLGITGLNYSRNRLVAKQRQACYKGLFCWKGLCPSKGGDGSRHLLPVTSQQWGRHTSPASSSLLFQKTQPQGSGLLAIAYEEVTFFSNSLAFPRKWRYFCKIRWGHKRRSILAVLSGCTAEHIYAWLWQAQANVLSLCPTLRHATYTKCAWT